VPRKLRLEFPGACYHVINRGNYRSDVFGSEGARNAFEACLFTACKKSGWLLHAFVIMRNHFHLAVETPDGNLVSGMHWLQATFANRFNKLRGERGHLFQGRYKALPVEDGGPLGQVCDYIHLNPVRAGVVSVDELGEFRHSSYWYLCRPKHRPEFLRCETAMFEAGGLADTAKGRRSYSAYLAWQASEGPAGRGQAYVNMSRGWALGTAGFKKALIRDHGLAAVARAWERGGAREIREDGWLKELGVQLDKVGKTRTDAQKERKSVRWKAEVALAMKQRTQATNKWLTEHLYMGRPEAVSVHVGRLKSVGTTNV
jgi:putative transposase